MGENSSLIYDTGTSRCLLKESTTFKPSAENKNVLGVLEGPCSDFTQETRNKNYYTKALWEKVLGSDYVKEALDTHTLFGSLDHPENLDNFASDAAVCCTKLWIDEKEQCLMGSFDVLPTVKGKILDSLLKYGSILGVSSRGVGDLSPMASGAQMVDEDSYLFVCFDVVTQPAAIKARQKYKSLTESTKAGEKSVLDTLIESLGAAQTERDVDSIVSIATKLGLQGNKKLQESLEVVKSNLKKDNISSIINVEVMKRDLEEAYKKIRSLEESQRSSLSILAAVEALGSNVMMTKSLIETYQSDQASKGRRSQPDISRLLNALLEGQKTSNDNFVKLLSQAQQGFDKSLSLLNESLNSERQKVQGYKEKNKSLTESLEYSIGFVDKCKTAIQQRDSLIGQMKEENKRLLESIKQPVKPSFTQPQQKVAIKESQVFPNPQSLYEYAKQKGKEYSVDLTEAIPEINNCKTKKDVDTLVQRIAISGPISGKGTVSVLEAITPISSVDDVGALQSSSSEIIRSALKGGNGR